MGDFSVMSTLPRLNPLCCLLKLASSVPYDTRTYGTPSARSHCKGKRSTHHIKLLQLGGLHPSLTVPQADSEALGVVLDLVFPLHESHNGRRRGTASSGARTAAVRSSGSCRRSAPSGMNRVFTPIPNGNLLRSDTHVLPMPISSASIPPFHCPSSCFFIQYRLSFWNGKSWSLSDGCASIATGLTGVTLAWRSPQTLSSSG
jgi:hypothetical protein